MPKVFVNAPVEAVYSAVCDIPRHARWAVHDINIEGPDSGPPQVGHTYSSMHVKAKAPDRITITELVPNQRLGFHVAMPNNMEFQFTMAVSPQDNGTLVSRDGKPTRIPGLWKLLFVMGFPLFLVMANSMESKMLKKMKADLEQPSGS